MITMRSVRIILVGGFLGAGKTTLLWKAAQRLAARGLRVGLITNDQAPDLVDTRLLAAQGMHVREVAGSCFCCNFAGLLEAAGGLRNEIDADVLLAEPVGSCTDLSATILQPLKERYREEFTLAPLTVLADPVRLRQVVEGRGTALHPSAAYIYRTQLAEADIVAIAKTDAVDAAELDALGALVGRAAPEARMHRLSSRTGAGLDAWLDEVMTSSAAGRRIAAVDYDTYAEGEAVLGWLNAEVRLSAVPCCIPDWTGLCRRFVERLSASFAGLNAEVGHVKVLMTAGDAVCVANLTGGGAGAEVRGGIDAAAGEVACTVNARVAIDPGKLVRTVLEELDAAAGACARVAVERIRSIRPGRPNPTYRYARVV
jgi:Ni2+-binding GTPase involved in maturation of urease and hydrogenase